jgi:WD40 repeat protein
MAQATRTFRIFVSSTFHDLKEERNALQEKVFPRLRELCLQHRGRFQPIDLRWGVSEQASLDQQAMNICLGEIARCQKTTPRPNFIVLLGDRYGWRPLPSEIPADEFEEIERRISGDGDKALLASWYKRDDNAVPAEYCLQPRTGEFEDYGVWEQEVERPLHSTLRRAIEAMELTAEQRLKYVASATHQEIARGALQVADAPDHVFCFFRSMKVLPEDARPSGFVDLDEEGNADEEACRQLEDLKSELRRLLPSNIHEYGAEWTGNGPSAKHLDLLCDDVYQRLSQVILAEVGTSIVDESRAAEEMDPVEAETKEHERFGIDRARFFVGREKILETIRDYVKGTDPHPLAVWAQSGSGKSALMAKAVQQAGEMYPHAEVVFRFIGATPHSSNGRALLESLCRQISRRYDADESTVPTDYSKLIEEFSERLALAAAGKPLILFLDALDQLSDADNARNLAWLPANLPDHVRLVVSTLPWECRSLLQGKLPQERLVELESMPPQQGSQLLDLWLDDARRILRKHQRKEVLSRFNQEGNGLPLYLKLAFEEARRWKSYTAPEETILGPDVPGVIRDLFARLAAQGNHGEMLVSRSLGYLTAAKNGLAEDELLDLLSADEEVMADFRQRSPYSPDVDRLPVVVWSRLFHDLEPYLTTRVADVTVLMTFYHLQPVEVVEADYLAGKQGQNRHRALAAYFQRQGLRVGEAPNMRKLSELPHHQIRGKMWFELAATLTDLQFLEAKCAAGMTHDLVAEYSMAVSAMGIPEANRRAIDPFARFVRARSHVLARRPDLIAQEAFNFAASGPVLERAEQVLKDPGRLPRPWLRRLHRPMQVSRPCLQTLVGHTGWVTAVAVVGPDGRHVVTGGFDRTIRVWELATGACVRALEGHAGAVRAVRVTPDGRRLVSGSHDKTARVWDLASGVCLQTLEGHTGWVHAVAVTSDGRRAVTGSADNTVKVWQLETGTCLQTLECQQPVAAVAVTPDGRYLVTGMQNRDKPVKVWDLHSGKCSRTLEGHWHWVESIALTPDGRQAVTGSRDWTARVWNLQTGTCLRTLEGHAAWVLAVALTPDARQVVTSSADQTIKVWDLETGACLRTLEGHVYDVSAVAVTPDGRQLVTGSWDDTVRLWDLRMEVHEPALEKHTAGVSVAITLDGRQAVTGSWDETVKVWDLQTGECLQVLDQVGAVTAVALTPDGRQAVTGSGHATFTAAPDGQHAATLAKTFTVNVWDLERGTCQQTLEGHADHVTAAAVTPDGCQVVTGSWDKTVKVWDLRQGTCLRTLEHTGKVHSVAVTPDGRHMVTWMGDDAQSSDVSVWHLSTGARLRTLGLHSGVVGVAPDGYRAVAWSEDGMVRVWNLQTGECLQVLEHMDMANVTVTPDGRRAAIGSGNTLQVWDLQMASEVACFFADDPVDACVVSPDGTRILAVGQHGGVYFLALEGTASGAPAVTAWQYAKEEAPAFGCPFCRTWSQISTSTLGAELPCPECGKTIRLNPLTIIADWRPVARAWRGGRD